MNIRNSHDFFSNDKDIFINALVSDDAVTVISMLRTCTGQRSVGSLLQPEKYAGHSMKQLIQSRLTRYISNLLMDDPCVVQLKMNDCGSFLDDNFIMQMNDLLQMNRDHVASISKNKNNNMQVSILMSLIPELDRIIGDDKKTFNDNVIGLLLADNNKISENANRVIRRLCTFDHPKAVLVVEEMYKYRVALKLDMLQMNKDKQCAFTYAQKSNPDVFSFFSKVIDQDANDTFIQLAQANAQKTTSMKRF
jgi:hypothetical protein